MIIRRKKHIYRLDRMTEDFAKTLGCHEEWEKYHKTDKKVKLVVKEKVKEDKKVTETKVVEKDKKEKDGDK